MYSNQRKALWRSSHCSVIKGCPVFITHIQEGKGHQVSVRPAQVVRVSSSREAAGLLDSRLWVSTYLAASQRTGAKNCLCATKLRTSPGLRNSRWKQLKARVLAAAAWARSDTWDGTKQTGSLGRKMWGKKARVRIRSPKGSPVHYGIEKATCLPRTGFTLRKSLQRP